MALAYASVDDVQDRNRGRTLGASSIPSAEEVSDFLDQTAGVINGILRGQGYEVPVSPTAASAAYITLKGINAIGAAALVEQAAKVSDRREEAMAMWREAQKMLRDGVLELDAAIDTTQALPRSGFDSTATSWFSRDMEL